MAHTPLILPRTRFQRFVDRVSMPLGVTAMFVGFTLLAMSAVEYSKMESKVMELENKLKECSCER